MSNLYKFLSLIIFIVVIWSINSFLLPRVSTDLVALDKAKRELSLKKSFNDSNPANLSKSINEFVLKQFDKNKAINLIDSFARESGVFVSSLDLQLALNTESNVSDEDLNLNIASQEEKPPTLSNTLKTVNLRISIKGNKNSIDSFIARLANSQQYIDIQDINISNSDTDGNELQSTIIANIYYVQS